MDGESAYVRNVTSIRELVAMFYGGLIQNPPVESDYTVGTTVVALGSGRGQRTGYTISNTGSVNAALGFNPNVTITTGILLLQGGSLTIDWYFDQDLVFAPIYAIGASASATLHMVEKILSGA